MSRGLRIFFGVLAILELVRGVRGALLGDPLDATFGLAMAVLFGFFAAGVTHPARGSVAWYAMWGTGIVALLAVIAGFLT